jgi:hypothetical protein
MLATTVAVAELGVQLLRECPTSRSELERLSRVPFTRFIGYVALVLNCPDNSATTTTL